MVTRASLLALIQELEAAFGEYERAMALNLRAWERLQSSPASSDPLDWGALGFTLHASYGILENYFLRISKQFENSLPPERWQRTLVEKMVLDIPGLRPALLPRRETMNRIVELLKFRHRFRNLYGEDLDPEKTSAIQAIAMEFKTEFETIHTAFIAKLRSIAEALE